MELSALDRMLNRLPYSDGTGRRRLVAGGIVLIGIVVFNWEAVGIAVGDVEVVDIVTSPLIVIGAVLLVYAIGSVIEVFGDYFLIRAASGVFWAIGLPRRVVYGEPTWHGKLFLGVGAILALPMFSCWSLLKGIFGRTRYSLDIEHMLTPRANIIFRSLPSKVADGLSKPVGDDAELALKLVVEMMADKADRKWARYLVNRTKDISTITTALFVLVLIAFLSGVIGPWSPRSDVETERFRFNQNVESVRNIINDLGKGITLSRLASARRTLRGYLDGITIENAARWYDSFDSVLQDILGAEADRIRVYLDEGAPTPPGLEISRELVTQELFILAEEIDSVRSAAEELVAISEDLKQILPKIELLATLQTIAFVFLFFLLYVGFFSSLRNLIITIFENMVIKSESSLVTSSLVRVGSSVSDESLQDE